MSTGRARALPQSGQRSRRRTHRKSRTGCANCRLRRVKCTEEHPSCRKCLGYYVSCSYESNASQLEAIGERVSGNVRAHTPSYISPHQNLMLKTHVDDEIMYRFRNRTVYTFGTPETVELYMHTAPRLAVYYRYLRHAIYATTLAHDRALARVHKSSNMEAYHLGQAAEGFNHKLSTRDFEYEEGDAIWTTAVYLCAISAASIDVDARRQNSLTDGSQGLNVEWLNMQKGLGTIWQLTHMDVRCTSTTSGERRGKFNCAVPDIPESGIQGVPPLLVELYSLNSDSNTDNHPYHAAVRYLTTLLSLETIPANTLKFLIFAGGMTNEFQALLQQKDPRALLLKALWYTKLFNSQWWIRSRARIECVGICEYLKQLEIEDPPFSTVLRVLATAIASPDLIVVDSLSFGETPGTVVGENPQEEGPTSYKADIFWL